MEAKAMLLILPGLPPERLTGSSFPDRKKERRKEEEFYAEHAKQPVFSRLLALLRDRWRRPSARTALSGRDAIGQNFAQTTICNDPRLKPGRASFP
jgi:hypothetical protein